MNSIISFDLNKIVSIEFYYRNQLDTIRHSKEPKYYSCNGVMFNAKEYAPYKQGYELETNLERAIRLNTLDRWTPVITLRMVNGHPLTYEGSRALKILATWNAKIYGKKKHSYS